MRPRRNLASSADRPRHRRGPRRAGHANRQAPRRADREPAGAKTGGSGTGRRQDGRDMRTELHAVGYLRVMRSSDPSHPQPDRNIALELVRITEGGGQSGLALMGLGDKDGADGAAVDAMREVLGGISMDGRVVIGEGEKDEAPMLFNGEQVGNGKLPPHRRGRRPHRRHHAHVAGKGQRLVGYRRFGAGHDVRPRALRVHGEDRHRARGRPSHRHHQVAGGEPGPGRRRQGQGRARSDCG